MKRSRQQIIAHIEGNTEPSGSGCRLWRGFKNRYGYGVTSYLGKPRLAHRLLFQLITESGLDGLDVCHTCDTPACVARAHLFAGTARDNIHDAMRKGRIVNPPKMSGESHLNAKLTGAQVMVIRSRRKAGEGLRSLAEDYNTTKENISAICRRRTWRTIV